MLIQLEGIVTTLEATTSWKDRSSLENFKITVSTTIINPHGEEMQRNIIFPIPVGYPTPSIGDKMLFQVFIVPPVEVIEEEEE